MTVAAPWVIVVAYRAQRLLPGCLSALGDASRVVVVDNDGSDETQTLVAHAGAGYLRSPGNVGFARAVNLALASLPDDEADVLLLNPDARIALDDVLGLQAALHADDRLAAVGPRLVGPDGHEQAADWPLPSPGQVWFDAAGLGGRWRGPRFVTGAVLLLRRGAVRELGGLDERYFLYAEESDWQMNALRHGWRVRVVESVTAVHEGAASSNDEHRRAGFFYGSARRFSLKWYRGLAGTTMRVGAVVAALRRVVAGPKRDEGRLALRFAVLPLRRFVTPAPPHVVHLVCTDAFAGVERYVADVAPELARRGYRVTVVGGDPRRMRAALPPAVACHPAASVLEAARVLRGLGRVDLVHAHMTEAELAVAVAGRRRARRVVATRHFARRRGSSAPARVVARLAATRIDAQVAISEFVARAVEGDSTVVPNGVPTSSLPELVREPVVLVAQRFEAEKDTSTALRAWASSGLAGLGWRMELCGQGAEHGALKDEATALGVDDSVEFCGFVDDLRSRLRRASLFLATAPAEPFGLSVVEAMAEATPVIAADGGAHRETLGADGVYFPPGDAEAAAEQLRRLAVDDAARRALGPRLQRRQQGLFDVARHVDALEQVYRR